MGRRTIEVGLDDFDTEALIEELEFRQKFAYGNERDRAIAKLIEKKHYMKAIEALWEIVEDAEAERRAEKYLAWQSTAAGHVTQ